MAPKSDLVTTADAARILGVGTTSIKRWADMGLLGAVRTAGGHRRFRRSEVTRLLRDRQAESEDSDGWAPWGALLENGPSLALDGALLALRGHLGSWHRVADVLGAVITELGRLWECGSVGIGLEHVASERLARCIARLAESLPTPPNGPRCLLATAEGDEHTLGLSLAELCLKEAGWETLWFGRRTPRSEIRRATAEKSLRMVALSASPASDDASHLADVVSDIGDSCRQKHLELVLGGEGAWPETPSYGRRIHGFGDFNQLLTGHTGRRR
jgi:excisionase family DNA binding protein